MDERQTNDELFKNIQEQEESYKILERKIDFFESSLSDQNYWEIFEDTDNNVFYIFI